MIDISDVNVGDRVKLTRENGDEATFTVDLKVPSHGVIGSAVNRFLDKDWDTLEIVERAFKPVPGLYTNVKTNDRVMITEDGTSYYTYSTGSWIPITGGHVDVAAREKGDWSRDITF